MYFQFASQFPNFLLSLLTFPVCMNIYFSFLGICRHIWLHTIWKSHQLYFVSNLKKEKSPHSQQRKRPWAGQTAILVPPPFLLQRLPFRGFEQRPGEQSRVTVYGWTNDNSIILEQPLTQQSVVTAPTVTSPHCTIQQSWQKYCSVSFSSSAVPDFSCVCTSNSCGTREVPCFLWASFCSSENRYFSGISKVSKITFSLGL